MRNHQSDIVHAIIIWEEKLFFGFIERKLSKRWFTIYFSMSLDGRRWCSGRKRRRTSQRQLRVQAETRQERRGSPSRAPAVAVDRVAAGPPAGGAGKASSDRRRRGSMGSRSVSVSTLRRAAPERSTTRTRVWTALTPVPCMHMCAIGTTGRRRDSRGRDPTAWPPTRDTWAAIRAAEGWNCLFRCKIDNYSKCALLRDM